MLTGHGDIASTVTAMKMGAVDFLVKPFERETLLRAVENCWMLFQDTGARRQRALRAGAMVEKLTHRERDGLSGLTMDLTHKHIAPQFGIRPRHGEHDRYNTMSNIIARKRTR